ncbi:MAG: gamma-glutamyl-gamma-aminobutyrate hydrolase family protein [Actinomycetota bacterium]|nr:gamma-glutamyl-gamma-aminobutyrate hydrolase family protein [Actinomycetota bacterium]
MRARIGITSSPAIHDERLIERVNRLYVDAVARAGGVALILPTMAPDDADEMLAGLEGLLLTGGGDVAPWQYGEQAAPEVYGVDPARDAWELGLVAAASNSGMPILGVCRGAQLLIVAAGGNLIQHLPHVTQESHWQRSRHRELVHPIFIAEDSRVGRIVGSPGLDVNTIHHQAIARVGAGYRPVAWSPDGIIEAIEACPGDDGTDGPPVVGVQWHPESLVDVAPHGQLFLWLTRTAARRRPGVEIPESFGPPAPPAADLGTVVDDVA